MRLNETQLNDFRAFRKFNPVSLGVANQQINDLLDTIDALTRERDEAIEKAQLAEASVGGWHTSYDTVKLLAGGLVDKATELQANLALAEAAVAGAYQEAAEIIEASPTFHKHQDGPTLCHCEMCAYVRGNVTEIRARTPPAAVRAEKLLVAQAEKKIYSVLEERLRREYDPRLPFVKDFSDWVYSQLAAATATPEEIKEEKPDEQ